MSLILRKARRKRLSCIGRIQNILGIVQNLKSQCMWLNFPLKNEKSTRTWYCVMFFFFVDFDHKKWVRLSYCGCLLIILKLAMKFFFFLIVFYIIYDSWWHTSTWVFFTTIEIHCLSTIKQLFIYFFILKKLILQYLAFCLYYLGISDVVGEWLMSIWATTSTTNLY